MASTTGRPSGSPAAYVEGNYASPKNASSQDCVDLGLTLLPGSQANGESLGVDQNGEAKESLYETSRSGFGERNAENARLVSGEVKNGREQFTRPESEVKLASESHLSPHLHNVDSFSSSNSLHFPTPLLIPNLSSQPQDTAGPVSTAPEASDLSSPSFDPIVLPPLDLETEFPSEKAKSKSRKSKVPCPNSSVRKYFKTDAAFDKEWNHIANSERATVLLSLANLNRLSPYSPAKAVQPPLRYLPSLPLLHTIKTTAVMTANTETMESLQRQLAQSNWQRDFIFEELAKQKAANQGTGAQEINALRAENAQLRQNMQAMTGRLQNLAQNANQKVAALKATAEHWQKMYNSMAQIYHGSKVAYETPALSRSQTPVPASLPQASIPASQPQASVQVLQLQAPVQNTSRSSPISGKGTDAGVGVQNKIASPKQATSIPNNPVLSHGSVTGSLNSLMGSSSPAKKPETTPFGNISLQNTGDRVTLPSNFLPNGRPKSGITKKASKKAKEPRQEIIEKPSPEARAALQAMKRKDRTWLKEAQPEHKRQRLDSIATNELLTGTKNVYDPVKSAMANFSNFFPSAQSSDKSQSVDLTAVSSPPSTFSQPTTAVASSSSSSANPSTTTTAVSTPPSTVGSSTTNAEPQSAPAQSMPTASAPVVSAIAQPEKATQPATIIPALPREPPMPSFPERRPNNMTKYLFETIPSFDLNNPDLTDDELVLAGFTNRQEAVNYMNELHKMRQDYADSLRPDDQDDSQYRKPPEKIRESEPERRKTVTPPKAKKTNPAQCATNTAPAEPKATTIASKPKKTTNPPKAKKAKIPPPKPTVTAPPGYFAATDADKEEDEAAIEKEMEEALFGDSSDDEEAGAVNGGNIGFNNSKSADLSLEEAAASKELDEAFGNDRMVWTEDELNNDTEESLRNVFSDVFGNDSDFSAFQAPFANAFGNLSAPPATNTTTTAAAQNTQAQNTMNTTNYDSESEISEEE